MAVNVEMPLHKARELMAPYRNAMPINQPLPEIDMMPPDAPNVLVDAVSLGGAAGQKPLVRHVLVKDLNKIGTRMKFEHPKTGVFSNKAPMGLYAIFDGQSCAGEPGPMAAEFCARNFHTKLLKRLAELSPEAADEANVQAALVRTFEDLDVELLTNQPEIMDGCGASVCLLIGQTVFTAVLGQCSAALCAAEGTANFAPVMLGGRQGVVEADILRIRFAGGVVYGDGKNVRIRHPSGQESSISRSLGDRIWKDPAASKSPLVVSIPEVHSVVLGSSDQNPFLILATSTVASTLNIKELVDIGGEYLRQPRAACGEIATRALVANAGSAQCTAVKVCFLPPKDDDHKRRAPGSSGPELRPQQPVKKAKVTNARGGTTQSIRLRHLFVKFADGLPKDGKKPLRSRQEAETILRRALLELKQEVKSLKKPPKDATEIVTATSKKFQELCRKSSECESAKKGGAMCGDLGWLTPEELAGMGGSFKEVMEVLMPGQFSDIAHSDQGLHLAQRVA